MNTPRTFDNLFQYLLSFIPHPAIRHTIGFLLSVLWVIFCFMGWLLLFPIMIILWYIASWKAVFCQASDGILGELLHDLFYKVLPRLNRFLPFTIVVPRLDKWMERYLPLLILVSYAFARLGSIWGALLFALLLLNAVGFYCDRWTAYILGFDYFRPGFWTALATALFPPLTLIPVILTYFKRLYPNRLTAACGFTLLLFVVAMLSGLHDYFIPSGNFDLYPQLYPAPYDRIPSNMPIDYD